MYKVGIIAALEREVRPLIKSKDWGWRVSEREHGGRRFRFLEDGTDAVLICGGIGAQAARRAAVVMIELYSPTVIYSVGFAGALDPSLRAGEVVLPALVIDASDGSRANLSEGKGVLVTFGSVASPAQKAQLRNSYGAQLVDMEAAAVWRAAQAHGIKFAAVKAISDEFDFTFPEIEKFVDAQGQFQQGRFARFAAVRPWLWPKVNRLAKGSNRAVAGLNDWLTTSLNRIIEQAPDHKMEAMDRK
jgi:adenosylhomocysteine nucleosidase